MCERISGLIIYHGHERPHGSHSEWREKPRKYNLKNDIVNNSFNVKYGYTQYQVIQQTPHVKLSAYLTGNNSHVAFFLTFHAGFSINVTRHHIFIKIQFSYPLDALLYMLLFIKSQATFWLWYFSSIDLFLQLHTDIKTADIFLFICVLWNVYHSIWTWGKYNVVRWSARRTGRSLSRPHGASRPPHVPRVLARASRRVLFSYRAVLSYILTHETIFNFCIFF